MDANGAVAAVPTDAMAALKLGQAPGAKGRSVSAVRADTKYPQSKCWTGAALPRKLSQGGCRCHLFTHSCMSPHGPSG